MLVCRMVLPLSGASGGTGSQFGLYVSSIDSAFFSIMVAGIPVMVAFMFGGTFPVGVLMTIVAFGSFPKLTFVTFIDDAAAN